jgi:hypothetical protein
MPQIDREIAVLEYGSPDTPRGVGSGLGIASIIISALTALPFYGACNAVVESRSMPGHYLPLGAFSYLFWIVLIGAGLGLGLAMVGLRRNRPMRGFAVAGFGLSTIYLIGLIVMMILTRGGTKSA